MKIHTRKSYGGHHAKRRKEEKRGYPICATYEKCVVAFRGSIELEYTTVNSCAYKNKLFENLEGSGRHSAIPSSSVVPISIVFTSLLVVSMAFFEINTLLCLLPCHNFKEFA
jgi:hypothetical protein